MARVNMDALKKKLNSVEKSIETLQHKRDELKNQIDDTFFCKNCNTYQSEMIFKNIHHWGQISKCEETGRANYGEGITATLICPECGCERTNTFTSSWRGAGKDDKEFDNIVYETLELTSRNKLVGRWWKGEWDAIYPGK